MKFLSRLLAVLAIMLSPGVLTAASTARIVVHKGTSPEPGPLPAAVITRLAAAGYVLLAEYQTMVVFVGPPAAAAVALDQARASGNDAEVATDLDRFSFHDTTIDTEAGPPGPTSAGLVYFIALQSYTKDAWLQEFALRGVRVLQALPPAAFIVRADRTVASRLQSDLWWVRGVFPVPAALKAIGLDRAQVSLGRSAMLYCESPRSQQPSPCAHCLGASRTGR